MAATKTTHVAGVITLSVAGQKFVADMMKVTSSLSYFGGTLGGLMQTVTKFGYAFKALGAIGLGIGVAFMAAKKAAEVLGWAFDKLISGLSTLVSWIQKAANEYEKFERVAIDAAGILQTSVEAIYQTSRSATTLGISMNEAAKGMQEFARAGFTGAEAADMFTPAAIFARNASTNLNRATTLITGAMRAFGKETSDVSTITGVFTEAIFRSRMSFETLETAFAYAGAAGAAAGQKFEGVVATMMALRDQGLQASTSGTVFRRALSSFSKFGNEARVALANLGITMDKVTVSSKQSFAQVIQNLADLPRSADEIKKAMDIIIAPRFGGYISLLIDRVKKGQVDLFKTAKDLIANSDNQFDVFMFKLLSYSGQLDVFRSKIEEIWINAGRVMAPYFTQVLFVVNAFLDKLNKQLFGIPKSFEEVSKEVGAIDFRAHTSNFFASIEATVDSVVAIIKSITEQIKQDQLLRVLTTLFIIPMMRLAAGFVGVMSMIASSFIGVLNRFRTAEVYASGFIKVLVGLFEDIGGMIGTKIYNAIILVIARVMEALNLSNDTIQKFMDDNIKESTAGLDNTKKAWEEWKKRAKEDFLKKSVTETALEAMTASSVKFLDITDSAFTNWDGNWDRFTSGIEAGALKVKGVVRDFADELKKIGTGPKGTAPGTSNILSGFSAFGVDLSKLISANAENQTEDLPGSARLIKGFSAFGVDLGKMLPMTIADIKGVFKKIKSVVDMEREAIINDIDKSKREMKVAYDAEMNFRETSLPDKYATTGLLDSSNIVEGQMDKINTFYDKASQGFAIAGGAMNDFKLEVVNYNEFMEDHPLQVPEVSPQVLPNYGIPDLKTIMNVGQNKNDPSYGTMNYGLTSDEEKKFAILAAKQTAKEREEKKKAAVELLKQQKARAKTVLEDQKELEKSWADYETQYEKDHPFDDPIQTAKRERQTRANFDRTPLMDLNTAFQNMQEEGAYEGMGTVIPEGMPQSPREYFKFLDPDQLTDLYDQAQQITEERQLAMTDSIFLTIQDMTTKFQSETQLWSQFAMSAFGQIETGIATTLKNTIIYGKSMTGVWKDIAKGILGSMIDTFVKIQMQALITSIFSKKVKQSEGMARNATNVSNAFSAQAAFLGGMMLGPAAYAGAAAFAASVAGTAGSLMGAGNVGDSTPGMDTNGNGLVGAAAGTDIFGIRGTGNGDTIPAMLTPSEIVLNKSASDLFRDMVLNGNGGSGGITVNVSVQAIDAEGFISHKDSIVDVIKTALKDDASFRETAKVSLEG